MAQAGLAAVATALAAVAALLVAPWFGAQLLEVLRRLKVRASFPRGRTPLAQTHDSAGSFALAAAALRGLPGSTLRPVRAFASSRGFGLGSKRLRDQLELLGITCDHAAIWQCLAGACAAAFVVGTVFGGTWLVGFPCAAAVPLAVRAVVDKRLEGFVHRTRAQVPDALRSIDAALGAGQGLPRAIEYAAQCTPAPLGALLAQVVWDIKGGRPIEMALEGFQKRVQVPELRFVSVAMEVQHKSGGSLHPIIATAVGAARESFELERSLQVKTAQARLSARVVGFMPLALVLALSVISPGYFSGFASSALGVAMLIAAIVLDAAGLMFIRSIMNVKV